MDTKHLRRFATEALFEAAKSALPKPWVTLTDDDKKVHFKDLILPVIKITVADSFDDTDIIELTATKSETVMGNITWTTNLSESIVEIIGTVLKFKTHYEGDVILTATGDNATATKTINVTCEDIGTTTYSIKSQPAVQTAEWNATSANITFTGVMTTTYHSKPTETTETQVTETVTFEKNEPATPTDYTTGGELVDLGLPSGLKWASCNLGAKTETEKGLYFQWGDTEGYKSASTTGTPVQRTGTLQWYGCDVNWTVNQKGFGKNFRWADYKYCQGTNTTLTKYNTSSSYGTVDNKLQLEESDDAIIAHAGATTGTRMPTTEEWKELYDNTTNAWVAIDGVNGRKFTSKTDSSKYIFIPASGYAYSGSVGSVGSYGYVWSSSLNSSDPYYAYGMSFYSSCVYPRNSGSRYYGFSVRGVKPTKKTNL